MIPIYIYIYIFFFHSHRGGDFLTRNGAAAPSPLTAWEAQPREGTQAAGRVSSELAGFEMSICPQSPESWKPQSASRLETP